MADESTLGVLGALGLGGGEIDENRLNAYIDQVKSQQADARKAVEEQGSVLQQAYKSYMDRTQATREMIANQKPDTTSQWLALAAGLMGPTKTGSSFEGFSNGLNNMLPHIQANDKAKREQAMALAGLDEKTAEFGYKQQHDVMKGLQDTLKQAQTQLGSAYLAGIRRPNANLRNDVIPTDRGLMDLKTRKIIPGTEPIYKEPDQWELVPSEKLGKPPGGLYRVNKATNRIEEVTKIPDPLKQPGAWNWEERQTKGLALGLPRVDDPYVIDSPADRPKHLRADQERAEKALLELDTVANTARNTNNEFSRFLQIQEIAPGKFGWAPGFLPNASALAQQAEAIAQSAARHQRQPGEGAVSNFEGEIFQKMGPSLKKDPAANRNLILGVIMRNQLDIDKAQFMNDYVRHYGSLQGARSAWNQYRDANPVFDFSSRNAKTAADLKMNDNFMTYKEWFAKKNELEDLERKRKAMGK